MVTIQQLINQIKLFGLEILGRYYSVYRGFVVSNEDSLNMGRILVIAPSIFGKRSNPLWAYPKNVPSGSNYGIQWLPKNGEMVFLEFEFGDPKFPIWSHGYHLKDELPIEFTDKNDILLKTPSGHLIHIKEVPTDKNGEENPDYGFLIKHKDGMTLEIKKDGIYLNGSENKGLVKITELVDKFNLIEEWIQQFAIDYNAHTHPVPSLGTSSPILPINQITDTPVKTEIEDLENSNIKH